MEPCSPATDRRRLGRYVRAGLALTVGLACLGAGIDYGITRRAGAAWRTEQDGALAACLLGRLAEEYYVLQQVEGYRTHFVPLRRARLKRQNLGEYGEASKAYRAALDALEERFNAHLRRAAAAAGPQVVALVVEGQAPDGTRCAKFGSTSELHYRVHAAHDHVADDRYSGITVAEATLDDRDVLVFSAEPTDRFSGEQKKLGWTARIVIDPAVAPFAEPAPQRRAGSPLACALLVALAEEYHVLTQVEGWRTQFIPLRDERAKGAEVDPDRWREAQKDYRESLAVLKLRFSDHLQRAQSVAGARCAGLAIEPWTGGEPVLQSGDAGGFVPASAWSIHQAQPTGMCLARGSIEHRPVWEFSAQVYDRFRARGKLVPRLPWTARLWLSGERRPPPPQD